MPRPPLRPHPPRPVRPRPRPGASAAAAALAAALAAAGLGGCTRYAMDRPAPARDPGPEWRAVLDDAVRADGVDYALIESRRDVLEDFLAYAAEHGPVMDEMRESVEDRRIAFMANAYNAAVIYAVLEHRPLGSVQEVGGGLWSLRPGAGFFLGQEFLIDGSWQTLFVLEHQDIVGRYQEPLVHLTLNCASRGCPPLRYWEGRGLTARMKAALRAWLLTDHGMRWVDDGYAVSEIFFWYEDDFLDWSSAETLCEYLADAATGDRRKWLLQHAEDCPLGRLPYDWSLNEAAPADPGAGAAVGPADDPDGQPDTGGPASPDDEDPPPGG
jgi:hypothetical protein